MSEPCCAENSVDARSKRRPDDEGLACYCFQHSRRAIERELRELGMSPTLQSIRIQVQEKNCACEVRSPTGRCCVPQIEELVESTMRKGAA